MVILHVAPITWNACSGPTIAIPCLISAQNSLSNIKVALYISRGKVHPLIDLDYPVFYCAKTIGLKYLLNLPKPFNRPDLVIFHSTYIYRHAIIARELRKNKIPYIITPHGGMTKGAQRKKRVKKKLGNILFFRKMVNNAVAVHCLTEGEEKEVKLWGRPTFVVPNGIDMPALIKKKSQIKPGEPLRLLFIGRIEIYIKGLDILLEGIALHKRKDWGRNVSLWIAGPDHQDNLKKLHSLINRLDIKDSVKLLGPVIGREKERVFKQAHIYVQTSRTEGCSMSILEALAYGIPCLLSTGTNIAHEVEECGAGWCVEGTAESVASGLLNILEKLEELPRMAKKARALAEEKYNWNQIAQQMIAHYDRIISEY